MTPDQLTRLINWHDNFKREAEDALKVKDPDAEWILDNLAIMRAILDEAPPLPEGVEYLFQRLREATRRPVSHVAVDIATGLAAILRTALRDRDEMRGLLKDGQADLAAMTASFEASERDRERLTRDVGAARAECEEAQKDAAEARALAEEMMAERNMLQGELDELRKTNDKDPH